MTSQEKLISKNIETPKIIDKKIDTLSQMTRDVNFLRVESMFSGLNASEIKDVCESCFNKNMTIGMQEKGYDFDAALQNIIEAKETSA